MAIPVDSECAKRNRQQVILKPKVRANLTRTNVRSRDPATLPLQLVYDGSGGGRKGVTGNAVVCGYTNGCGICCMVECVVTIARECASSYFLRRYRASKDVKASAATRTRKAVPPRDTAKGGSR